MTAGLDRFLEILGWFTIIYFFVINLLQIFIICCAFVSHARDKRHKSTVILDQLFRSELNLPVSIIVPAYREEMTIRDSVKNLLNLRYPNFEVIVVSDGSPDRTMAVLQESFDLRSVPEEIPQLIPTKKVRRVYRSPAYPHLLVIDKENGGKADANNVGINASHNPYVLVIDADCVLEEDSILKIIRPFVEDPTTIATGGMIRLANGCVVQNGRVVEINMPKSLIARLQLVEYLRAFLFGRLGWAAINALLCISGAFGAFRRDIMIDCGGFRNASLGEDMELVVTMHRLMRDRKQPYRITFTPDPVCWTEAPEDITILKRQRLRWQKGTIDALLKYRKMLFNPKYGVVGMIGFPYYAFIETLSAPFEIFGYLLFGVCLAAGRLDLSLYLLFMLASIVLGMIQSLMVLVLEEIGFRRYPKVSHILRLVLYAIYENFGYRQLNVWWRFLAIIEKIRGGGHQWGEMTRKGFGGAAPAAAKPAAAVGIAAMVLFTASAAFAQDPVEMIRAKLNSGDYTGAAAIADKALAENPKDVDAMVVYGFGMLWKKDYDKSEKLFLRVLEIAPDYGDAAIGLIKNYTWSNRLGHLRKFIAEKGERFKKAPYTRLEVLQAELRIEQADHPDEFTLRAMEIAQAILKSDPKNKTAAAVVRGSAAPAIWKIVRDAERAVAESRLADAEKNYARAVEMDPANDDLRLSHARVLSWNGKLDESLTVLAQVLSRSPKNTDALNVKARVLSWSGRLSDAETAYRTILSVQPDNIEAKQGLADVLRWFGRADEALKLSEELVAAFPADEAIASNHARLLGQTGKHDEAIRFLQEFLEKNPNATQARAELSNQYTASKRFGDAVNELRKSIQLDGNNKSNFLALGKLYSWQDKTEEAVALYQTVLDRDPENVDALTGIGTTYRYAGLNTKALGFYQRAIAINPDAVDAQEGVRTIRESTAPEIRYRYSYSRYDDAEPPNQTVRTKAATEDRIVDYKYFVSPDNSLLFKASLTNMIEKDQRGGDRNYDIDRESYGCRWNSQWTERLSSVFNLVVHEYKDDLPAFSPLRNKRRRADFYGILQHRKGSEVTTLLYSQDDYLSNQTTGNLKIGNIITYDLTHQRSLADRLTMLMEATADWYSVTRITRETAKGSLTYKFQNLEGLALEMSRRHQTSPSTQYHTARLFWAKYYPGTKTYIYGHYKYEHEDKFHDSYHEADLLYSGPVKNIAEYTVEARYTDYFSRDQSWYGTAYLTFKY